MIVLAPLLVQAAAPATSCRWEEHTAGLTVVHTGPERDCMTWQSARIYAGVWFNQFEGAAFIAGATTIAEAEEYSRRDPEAAWLSYDDRSVFPATCRQRLLGHAYRVTFIGRAATKAETGPMHGFGHMGMWRSELLIDRVLSITDLGELPGPQVKPVGSHPPCH